MTNFSRQNFPFTIGNDPATTTTGVETVDFEVSTNGAVRVNGAFGVSGAVSATTGSIGTLTVTLLNATDVSVATTAAAGSLKVIASVSATVSVPVTAAAFFTIYDATGTPWRVPAYTTLTAP